MTLGLGGRRSHASSRILSLVVVLVALVARPSVALADAPPTPRAASLEWDAARKELIVSLAFRDAIDADILRKLDNGFPTTILFTGVLFRHGSAAPVSTIVQTCRIVHSTWEEIYRLEITRLGESKTTWTTTREGVLRRCAEVNRLLVATSAEVPVGTPVYLRGRVLVNPISPEKLEQIKRWVSRPARTGTAAPGDALFSTFTGLFMQRVGEAERILELVTFEILPVVAGATKNEI